MATRFRLTSNTTAPAVSPALQTYAHAAPSTIRRQLLTTDASALTTFAYAPDGADHLVAGDSLLAQFVSAPMAAGIAFTVNDGVKFAVQGLEAHVGNNLALQFYLAIVSEDGATVRRVLRAKTTEGGEFTTAMVNRFGNWAQTGATYTTVAGDRLVVEFSVTGTPTGAGGVQGHNASLRFGGAGAGGDLPENDTEAGTTLNPWIEFTPTITFEIPPTQGSAALDGVGSLAAAGGLVSAGGAALSGVGGVAADGTVVAPGAAYASHTNRTNVSTANQVGDRPAGTAADDLLIAHLALDDPALSVITVPTGWTAVPNGTAASAIDTKIATYYRVCDGTEPAAWTWVLSAATSASVSILRYVGAATSDPIPASNSQGTASGTAHASPSITPPVDGCLIVGLASVDKSSTQTPYWLPPTGYTERYDYESSTGFVEATAADLPQPIAAAVSITFTSNDADEGAVVILALRPAGPGVQQGAAALAALAGTAADGALLAAGAAAATGVASLDAAGTRYQPGASALAGAGTLAAGGGAQRAGQAALGGVAAVAADGSIYVPPVQGAAVVAGAGTLVAAGGIRVLASSALAGTATLSPSAAVRASGVAALGGLGSVAAAASRTLGTTSTLAGSAAVVAGGGVRLQAAALLAAQGALPLPAGALRARGAVAMAGVAQVQASTGPSVAQGEALLAALGGLAAAAIRYQPGAANVVAAAALLGIGRAIRPAEAILAASAGLSAASSLTAQAAAALSGVGVLAAEGVALVLLRSRAADIIEALLALFEPGTPLGLRGWPPALSGMLVDEGMSEPFVYQAGTLYAWEEAQATRIEDLYREDFTIRLVWVVDSGDEEAMGLRQRDVSQALGAKADGYRDALRTSGGDHPWEYATVADVDADYLRGFETRGGSMLVTGWRLV